MNAIVYHTTHNVSNWFTRFFSKLNRKIHKIGYARAARELTRSGYYEAANQCLKEMKKL